MMVLQGTGPTYVGLTQKLRRYRRSDVLAWIEAKTTTPMPSAPAYGRVVSTPPPSPGPGGPFRRRNASRRSAM